MFRHHNKAILELLKIYGGPEKVYEEYLNDLKNWGLLEKTRDTESDDETESLDRGSESEDSEWDWWRRKKKRE